MKEETIKIPCPNCGASQDDDCDCTFADFYNHGGLDI